MKVIFAADMSFNYLEGFPGKDKAHDSLKGAAEIFKKAMEDDQKTYDALAAILKEKHTVSEK